MKCVEIEALLADYVDGTLSAVERASVEQHLVSCPACREFAAEVQSATAFLARVPDVEPPPELAARIIFETQSGRHGALKPQSWWKRIFGPLVEPILQPRFAMGMALTILSFSMVARVTGIKVTEVRAEDLHPSKIWVEMENRAHRTWAGLVKRYENLKLVLEIQQQLEDWNEQQEEARKAKAAQDQEQQKGTDSGSGERR